MALENARLVHETRQRNAELALINSVQAAIAGELDPQAIYDLVGDKLQEVFDAQVVDIAVYDETIRPPPLPVRDRARRPLPGGDARPLIGFRKHVMETREPLLIDEDWRRGCRALRQPTCAERRAAEVGALRPARRRRARDRRHLAPERRPRRTPSTRGDQRLLTTLAGSLSVALDNARLVDETRQRVSELATVNSVGQALSSQLDLDALIELVGEQVRETFDADIAYVALHDEEAGRIDFAYYYETGERRPEPPIEYGRGSRRRSSGRASRYCSTARSSTKDSPRSGHRRSPISACRSSSASRSIGVISVQSIEEEGRFGEADSRLLATIAANVGVAIQNARLFAEVERQREYFESLVEISPAAVVVMDADERVTGWNPAAAELFGYSAEEAVGRLGRRPRLR